MSFVLYMGENMNKKEKILVSLLAAIVLIAVTWYLIPTDLDETEPTGTTGQETEAENVTPNKNAAEQSSDVEKGADRRAAHLMQKQERQGKDQGLLQEIQELLDANDENGAFELALSMSRSPSKELKSKALDAFRWIGGKRTVKACCELLKDSDDEIASEAMEVFRQSLESIDEDEGFSDLFPLIEDVMMECKDEIALEALFLQMSNLKVYNSLNMFMDLQERGEREQNTGMVEMAKEYIRFVTNGDESITSRTAMMKWLKQHQDD